MIVNNYVNDIYKSIIINSNFIQIDNKQQDLTNTI